MEKETYNIGDKVTVLIKGAPYYITVPSMEDSSNLERVLVEGIIVSMDPDYYHISLNGREVNLPIHDPLGRLSLRKVTSSQS